MKKVVLYCFIGFMLFLISCDRPEFRISNGEMVVKGIIHITYELRIAPGTKIYFQDCNVFLMVGAEQIDRGELIVSGDGKIIANGTADKPIRFYGDGGIYFNGQSANNSSFDYCEFYNVSISSSVLSPNCKIVNQ